MPTPHITFDKVPQQYHAANNPIVFIASCDESHTNLRFVVDLYESDGTTLIESQIIPPRPSDNKCYIDIKSLIRNYLSIQFPTVSDFNKLTDFYKAYKLKVSVIWNTQPTPTYTETASATESSEVFYAFHSVNDFIDFVSFDSEDYLVGVTEEAKFLTNFRKCRKLTDSQSYWIRFIAGEADKAHKLEVVQYDANAEVTSTRYATNPFVDIESDDERFIEVGVGFANMITFDGVNSENPYTFPDPDCVAYTIELVDNNDMPVSERLLFCKQGYELTDVVYEIMPNVLLDEELQGFDVKVIVSGSAPNTASYQEGEVITSVNGFTGTVLQSKRGAGVINYTIVKDFSGTFGSVGENIVGGTSGITTTYISSFTSNCWVGGVFSGGKVQLTPVYPTSYQKKYVNSTDGNNLNFPMLSSFKKYMVEYKLSSAAFGANGKFFISLSNSTETFNGLQRNANGTYEEIIETDGAIEKIQMNTTGASFSSVKVDYLMLYPILQDANVNQTGVCVSFSDKVIFWLNKLGGWDSFNFNMISSFSKSIDRKQFNKFIQADFDTSQRGKTTYAVGSQKTFKFISNFLDDATYLWLSELLESPEVYLFDGTNTIAVNITNSNYDEKKSERPADVPFLLEIDCELAVKNYSQTL